MEPHTTRTRLIAAMADALQRRGLHGVGLNEILSDAQAPKGVLYHHFPGGKTELAIAAIRAIVERIISSLDQVLAAHPDPAAAFERWVEGAQRHLAASSFERGM
jgi:TetR/AcrR family transcriptional repressor of lmrAB and yxaGH operons